MNTAQDFWSRVEPGPADTCWEWQGNLNRDGYGRFSSCSTWYLAHRVAFYLSHGHEPEQCVLHSCDNPRCCNPSHLSDGSNKENTAQMIARGRNIEGTDHKNAKLSADQVRELRRMRSLGWSHYKLGDVFGVSEATSRNVVARKRYSSVK